MLVVTLALTLLGVLAFGAWVGAAAPARAENRAFAAFALLAALWVTNDLAFFGFHGQAEPWARAAFLIALAMQLAFLRFTHVFPAPAPASRAELALTLVPGLALVPVAVAGAPLEAVRLAEGGRLELTTNAWTYALGAWSYALFALAWLRLLRARRAAADATLRRQLDLLLLADGLTGALTSLAIVVLPVVADSSRLLPYSSVALLLGTLVHGYAVLAFGFLRPRTALDEVQRFPVSAKLCLAALLAWGLGLTLVVGVARATVGAPDARWLETWAVGAVAAALPAIGLILATQELVVRPLRRVSEAALQVAGGTLGARVGLHGRGDEVGVLARAFDAMVERLEKELAAQRERAELLARAERLAVAGTLASGVAHEVNNPLAAVSSLVQTAQGRTDDPQVRSLLDDAVTQMERVAAALRDLMDVARPRARTREDCRLAEVVAATLRLLAHDPRLRRAGVRAEVAPDLPPVAGDPDQLQQVLLNLLLNARDAVEGASRAEVVVGVAHDRAANEVVLTVRDTGPGVPPELRERIFEPFFTTKPVGRGTGLGLAVTRDLVRAHGGRLELESRPGDTRFTVRLPALGGSA